ncbi:MAG: hypothetical protein ACTSPV_18955, partial [Candidatus Hodarchaeales archaeon]
MRLKRLVEKLLDSVFVAEFSLCLRCNRLVFGLGNYMYYVYLVYGPEICEEFEDFVYDRGYSSYFDKLSVHGFKKLFKQFI